MNYDRLLETVPTNLIAKMFHFKKEEFFKVGKPKRLRSPFSFDLEFRGEEVAL
ncbi:hypothetical protein ABID13_004864 [Enterocloster citroniae]|uniref:Uncharacterized protein n=1 Tax=Enterocloster citroniae TaxID=358743 RepID=A0ABV2G526_9FIRM